MALPSTMWSMWADFSSVRPSRKRSSAGELGYTGAPTGARQRPTSTCGAPAAAEAALIGTATGAPPPGTGPAQEGRRCQFVGGLWRRL